MALTLDFSSHRQSLLQALEEDEAVLVFGAASKLRNGDAEYRYRQSSDMYWLTGWEDPDAAVLIRHGDAPYTLFVAPKDPSREIWDGYRPGPEGARSDFGADDAYEIAELPVELSRLLQGIRRLHYAFAEEADHDTMLMGAIARARKAARRNGLSTPETFHHPSLLLHELRLRKNDAELNLMRQACTTSAQAHRAAMAMTAPGRNEFEVEACLMATFQSAGSTGPGYTPIVATGNNGTTLHYVRNRDVLGAGDLLLVDAGCECGYYTADITRTWPVDGVFTPIQRQLYEWVLKAQLAAIDQCRPGVAFDVIHQTAITVLTEGMVDLGLLEGPASDRIEDESFKRYYMHGTSHWLGLDVHDVGVYGRDGKTRSLEPGMVLTIEPGLYINATDLDAPEALRGLAVRIEDDVLITAGDPDVLTHLAPKTVAEIEAACAQG